MTPRRFVPLLALLALGLTALLLWRTIRPDPAVAEPVLKVASQRGSTRAVMEASGVLTGVPYRIEWSEFAAASPLLEALSAGAVDLGGVGDAPFAFAVAAGAPIVAVKALRSNSDGRSVALLVPAASPVRTLADLKGHAVATVRGSVGHYLVIRALQQAGLPPGHLKLLFLNPGESKAALAEGSIDGWATWAPYIGLALAGDSNRVVVDGKGLFSGISYIAAARPAVAARAPQIADFLARLGRAMAWARANPDTYAAALARETKMPVAVARDSVRRQDFAAVPIDAAIIADTRATLAHFRDAGLIDTIPDLGSAFTTRFNGDTEAPKKGP